jgi:uncharacterized protein (TIGR02246 family)
MRIAILAGICLFTLLRGDDAAVRAVLAAQAEAWNRGDLAAFVETYEDSPAITFYGRTLTRGRAGVLARYRTSYPTREKMGTLRFEIMEVRALGSDHALLLGRYFLTRTAEGGGDATGPFTLILHKGRRGWKIIHDHTS